MLPAVLAVLVPMAALSALALMDAAQDLRVAGLAADRVEARAAAIEGLSLVWRPAALESLCLLPPVTPVSVEARTTGGATVRVRWRHLGRGLIRADVEGVGRRGARQRLQGYLRPDSLGGTPPVGCAGATRLVPAGADWIEGHIEG